MKISTRETCGKYIEVKIEVNNTTIDLGFNDTTEALNLLLTLRETCGEIEHYLQSQRMEVSQ